MAKTIDDQTLDRAVKTLFDDYVFSVGVSNLAVQRDYKLKPSESFDDECFDVTADESAPENYRQSLPSEFEGYKVFYQFQPRPVPY